MTEIEKLLNELRNMKSEERAKYIANNKQTWSCIGSKDLEGAGFDSESELTAWLDQNDYKNI